jgi:hypothetical protein
MKPCLRRNIITIFVAALFFCTSLALAVHHDDLPFQSVSCSICKVKGSASGTPNKIKTGSTLSIACNASLVTEACLVFSGRVTETVIFPPSSLDFSAYTNKAPPIQL